MYTCIHMYTHVCQHIQYMHIWIDFKTDKCSNMYTHVCTYVQYMPVHLWIDYMCMYVYVLHVCNVIHTDTYTYMYIHANTYTYIHIHTSSTPHNQCHKGVLGCCCCRTRLLCAAPPTQICSDGAQDGISMQPLRVEGPWAAQGSCFPPPLRVQGARARQNGSGQWVP
jgi:hypothetical protein